MSAVTVKSRPCSGGIEAAKIKVDVKRAQGNDARSLSRIKRIEKGYRIVYTPPSDLPPEFKNNTRVAVFVGAPESGLTILEFRPAGASAEWIAPVQANLVVFALGPQGLDEKRVNTLITKDEELISSLADYADQTVEIEDTVETLTALDEEEDLDTDAFGTRLDRANPSEQALYTLLRAINPTLMSNNPLGAGKRMGPQSLMNKASVGFFENAGGLFPGGGALSEIKPWLLPDTDFRGLCPTQR